MINRTKNSRSITTGRRKIKLGGNQFICICFFVCLVLVFVQETFVISQLRKDDRSRVIPRDSNSRNFSYASSWSIDNNNINRSTQNFQHDARLWLYVSKWREGMSDWMKSITENLIVAKSINATFVEPCVRKGRLVSCANRQDDTILLSDIFDKKHIEDLGVQMASYDVFRQETMGSPSKIRWLRVCMDSGRHNKQCRNETARGYGKESLQAVNVSKFIRRFLSMSVVIEFESYKEGAFKNFPAIKADPREAFASTYNYLQFRREHYEHVDGVLEKIGIARDSSFSVIHWRAELQGMDYLECANAITKIADNLNEGPVLLMSSLNKEKNLTWAGAHKMMEESNNTAYQALDNLVDHGLIKLDNLTDQKNRTDIVLLSVWDLILAQKATKFVTCARRCPDSNFCSKCNHRGSFAVTAIILRGIVEKESERCWPE